MYAVAFAPGKLPDLLLLIAALEVEGAHIGARRRLALAEYHHVEPIGNLFPNRLVRVQGIARLIHVSKLYRLADPDFAGIWLILPGDHPEQRRLTCAVRADDADDGARRQLEAQVLDKEVIAEALPQITGFHNQIAQAWARGNGDAAGFGSLFLGAADQLFIGLNARLGLCLPRLGRLPDPVQLLVYRPLACLLLACFLLKALAFLLQPAGIVALVGNAPATIQLQYPSGHIVQEVAIVSDRHYGSGVLL